MFYTRSLPLRPKAQGKQMGLFHRNTGDVFQSAVSVLCPGGGSQLRMVSLFVTEPTSLSLENISVGP